MSTEMLVPVFARARMPGWPKQEQGGAARYMPASQAFADKHPTDAHFAAYVLPERPIFSLRPHQRAMNMAARLACKTRRSCHVNLLFSNFIGCPLRGRLNKTFDTYI
jgi:hypothetical protein